MYYITHGSENSLDHDIYVIVDEPLSNIDAKELCYSFNPMNANIICIKDSQVVWSYKGTIDECNNSIIATFDLHPQTNICPVTKKMERSYGLKLLRTLRGILSYCSQTDYRQSVKKALRSTNIIEKLEVISSIDLSSIMDYKKNSLIEVYKFFAFQLGQTLALLEDNVELFTKNAVSNYYPDLQPYLMREECNTHMIKKYWNRFYQLCLTHTKVYQNNELLTEITFISTEVFDTKKEILVHKK